MIALVKYVILAWCSPQAYGDNLKAQDLSPIVPFRRGAVLQVGGIGRTQHGH